MASDAAAPQEKMILLGIDGMDPVILRDLMERGEMPRFAALASQGGFSELRSVMPPQSPVAWAVVITGLDPGGTAIFDFIHRDPNRMTPFLSTSRVEEPEKVLRIGSWVLPLEEGVVEQLRKGTAFWEILDDHQVPAMVLKMPSNFPPVETSARTLSGMGTPDLQGTYGTYHFFTDDSTLFDAASGGGKVHPVNVEEGVVKAKLPGPDNNLKEDAPTVEVDFQVFVDPDREVVRVDIADRLLVLKQGEWSPWVQVDFPLIPLLASVQGLVRFHLAGAHPYLRLYASPLNMDPLSPALPISTPDDFAAEIADEIGLFYTQGMPEDTQALSAGLIDDTAFMRQAGVILEEEDRMLDYALEHFEEGFLFVYFSVVDQVSHMMWRTMDASHPMWSRELQREHGDAIPSMYRAMDRSLGRVLDGMDDDTILLVMSDHGFAPYNREVNLNTWLKDQGYLVLTDDSHEIGTQYFNNVDWGRTRAYSVGFNGLYLNRRGRERWGIVEPGPRAEALMDEIEEKLLAYVDHATGVGPVARLHRAIRDYQGEFVSDAPDLLVGYRRGYRASESSALGTLTRPVIQDRLDAWSGDHLMDPAAVPGVLLSNRPLGAEDPGLEDIAPTILQVFQIQVPPEMIGKPLLADQK